MLVRTFLLHYTFNLFFFFAFFVHIQNIQSDLLDFIELLHRVLKFYYTVSAMPKHSFKFDMPVYLDEATAQVLFVYWFTKCDARVQKCCTDTCARTCMHIRVQKLGSALPYKLADT